MRLERIHDWFTTLVFIVLLSVGVLGAMTSLYMLYALLNYLTNSI